MILSSARTWLYSLIATTYSSASTPWMQWILFSSSASSLSSPQKRLPLPPLGPKTTSASFPADSEAPTTHRCPPTSKQRYSSFPILNLASMIPVVLTLVRNISWSVGTYPSAPILFIASKKLRARALVSLRKLVAENAVLNRTVVELSAMGLRDASTRRFRFPKRCFDDDLHRLNGVEEDDLAVDFSFGEGVGARGEETHLFDNGALARLPGS